MRSQSTYLRIGTGVLMLVVVAVVLLLDSPGDDPDVSPPPPTTSSTPSGMPTAPPSPVRIEDFCAGFSAMAAAHANHLANDTEETLLEVTAAAERLRQLALGTVMAPPARQGLEELIDGVVEEPTEAPDQESADAFSAFLEVSCPAVF